MAYCMHTFDPVRYDSRNKNVVAKLNTFFNKQELSLMEKTPISGLNSTTQASLDKDLTKKDKLVEREDQPGVKILNNYKGVGELLGVEPETMEGYTSSVLELLKEIGENTVHALVVILLCIKRADVVRNCRGNILNDCRLYTEQQNMRSQMLSLNENQHDDDYSSPPSTQPWSFHAFICSAMVDFKKALALVTRLESCGLRIYFPERDLLPGSPIHTVNAFFIEERCKHMVVLLTSGFKESPECLFQLKFANALDPAARAMKIIPVKVEETAPVPRILNFVSSVCDLNKNGLTKLVNMLKSEHRVKREVLEQISYPQQNAMSMQSIAGELESLAEDDTSLGEEIYTRNRPDGQERVSSLCSIETTV